MMESLKGHLLVASSYLADPNFEKAVVLLIHHSEDGTFGVVLNRPGERTIKELWDELGEKSCAVDQQIHLGGPVSGPLMAVHTDQSLSEMEILPGLYFAAQRGNIAKLISRGGGDFRLFVGHSGWGGGQLEGELEEGSWLTAPATIDYVFTDETELWKTVTRDIGTTLLSSVLKIKDIPKDPSVN